MPLWYKGSVKFRYDARSYITVPTPLDRLLEQLGEDELELPLLFTVELDKEMSLFGFPFRYTFLLAGREHFHSLSREYEVDKETEELCLSEDTDCIVIYTGMSLQG